jgi:hypothetical protein
MVESRLPEGEEETCKKAGVDEKRTTNTVDQRDQVMHPQGNNKPLALEHAGMAEAACPALNHKVYQDVNIKSDSFI